MKKIVLILGVALSILACNKTETNSKEFKTFSEAREYFFEYRNYYKN
jgi:outer membrane protein